MFGVHLLEGNQIEREPGLIEGPRLHLRPPLHLANALNGDIDVGVFDELLRSEQRPPDEDTPGLPALPDARDDPVRVRPGGGLPLE